jgi:hypothetical protein
MFEGRKAGKSVKKNGKLGQPEELKVVQEANRWPGRRDCLQCEKRYLRK